ncbi:MAG: hypothetical protein ACPL3B_04760 [Fervidobacterium sp.]
MVREFIAELDNIGKLVDKHILNQQSIQIRGHAFADFDFLQLGISKPSLHRGQVGDVVYNLWNIKFYEKKKQEGWEGHGGVLYE